MGFWWTLGEGVIVFRCVPIMLQWVIQTPRLCRQPRSNPKRDTIKEKINILDRDWKGIGDG